MRLLYIFIFFLLVSCAKNNTVDEHIDMGTESELSQTGILKRKIKTNKPGDQCANDVYIYNKKGQIVERLDYEDCDKLFKKVKYTYDANDRIAISRIESDVEAVTYIWNYNDKGQLIEKVATRPTKDFRYRYSYTYDADGNQIMYEGSMDDGRPYSGTSRKEFFYDNGKKVKTVCYTGNDFTQPSCIINHLYDVKGKEIKNIIYNKGDSTKIDTVYISYEYY